MLPASAVRLRTLTTDDDALFDTLPESVKQRARWRLQQLLLALAAHELCNGLLYSSGVLTPASLEVAIDNCAELQLIRPETANRLHNWRSWSNAARHVFCDSLVVNI